MSNEIDTDKSEYYINIDGIRIDLVAKAHKGIDFHCDHCALGRLPYGICKNVLKNIYELASADCMSNHSVYYELKDITAKELKLIMFTLKIGTF